MDDLGFLIYEAMKPEKGFSENQFYEVKIVRTGENLIKKVKIKLKESGVKVTVPYELFLTNNEFDESSLGLVGGAISLIYVPLKVCNLF